MPSHKTSSVADAWLCCPQSTSRAIVFARCGRFFFRTALSLCGYETALLGCYISLGGPVTFKNAVTPKEVAKQIPLDRLLVETDSPYLAPHPFRGKRNEPLFIKNVLAELSVLLNKPICELEEVVFKNSCRVLGV